VSPAAPSVASPLVGGFVCATCGTRVSLDAALSWRCPHATDGDRHHVLALQQPVAPLRPDLTEAVAPAAPGPADGLGTANPFLAFRRRLAWDSFAASLGMGEADRIAFIREADARIARVAGTGFRATPFARHDALSGALGFVEPGGVWVKDETRNVAGSQKARHLFTILLHLLALERVGRAPWRDDAGRPPLAIASCGNAAIAASTLARAVDWPIRVFVPLSSDAATRATLDRFGARVETCARRDDDPPGDPCVHRFRAAVAQGCVPFGVQGPENAWCLDGGRTLGWEMAVVAEHTPGPLISRLFVQVGGGAFLACTAQGFFAGGTRPRVHAVQTEGCAPLARAWERAGATGGVRGAGPRWDACMWPWETTPVSLADGILDDETYDWISDLDAMAEGGGWPVVAGEHHVVAGYELAHAVTNVDVSPTGASGLAGVLAMRDEIDDDERIAVVFSGIRRGT